MLRVLIVVALAAATSLAAGCGDDEGVDRSRSDASSDVTGADVPEDSLTDTGLDASGDADTAADADASGDADASAGADASDGADAVADALTVSDADAGEPDAGGKLGVLSVAELAAALPTKSFLLINVHVPYAGEIPGTDKNLSYQNVPAIEAFIGSNKGVDVVVYCYSNSMSTIAGTALVKDGYTNVRYMDGGLAAWKNAGHPVAFYDN